MKPLWFDLKDGFTILTTGLSTSGGALWFDLKDGFTILSKQSNCPLDCCGLI